MRRQKRSKQYGVMVNNRGFGFTFGWNRIDVI